MSIDSPPKKPMVRSKSGDFFSLIAMYYVYPLHLSQNDKRALTTIFISASIDFYFVLSCLAYIMYVECRTYCVIH